MGTDTVSTRWYARYGTRLGGEDGGGVDDIALIHHHQAWHDERHPRAVAMAFAAGRDLGLFGLGRLRANQLRVFRRRWRQRLLSAHGLKFYLRL